MRIVRIFGGLGNQMFQYAFAIALKFRYRQEVVRYDASCMKGYKLHNQFELDKIFNLSLKQASFREIIKVGYPFPHYKLWQLGNRILPKRKRTVFERLLKSYNQNPILLEGDYLFDGYWQNENYFKECRDCILREFSFPKFEYNTNNEHIYNLIKRKNSVSIHIRRGDYINISSTQGICTIQYYINAIKKLKEYIIPSIFIVFSDDIEWCKSNLRHIFDETPTEFIDWNSAQNSYRDMQLMSNCNHNIIANSSFSWWGAWLNTNVDKIVIAPSIWMNDNDFKDIIPREWIRIN